jgi:pilus assembly protein Flp/PilA
MERRWGFMLFHKKERGQGMVEYALLIVLLAIVVVFMIDLMGTAVSNMYSSIVVAFPVH